MNPLPISLPTPSLLTNWPRVLRQAWSIRFSLLAFAASLGATVARLVAQPKMHEVEP